jgi:hypothetical protein
MQVHYSSIFIQQKFKEAKESKCNILNIFQPVQNHKDLKFIDLLT